MSPPSDSRIVPRALLAAVLLVTGSVWATASNARIPDLSIARIEGRVVIDGELNDPAWQQAARVEEWYETAPGDNVAPKVETIGYLAYDDRYLCVGFDCRDPDPRLIRAPLADRDSLTGNVDHGELVATADLAVQGENSNLVRIAYQVNVLTFLLKVLRLDLDPREVVAGGNVTVQVTLDAAPLAPQGQIVSLTTDRMDRFRSFPATLTVPANRATASVEWRPWCSRPSSVPPSRPRSAPRSAISS